MESKSVKLASSTCNRISRDTLSRLQQGVFLQRPFLFFYQNVLFFLLSCNLNVISSCNKNYSIKTRRCSPTPVPANYNVYQMHTSITIASAFLHSRVV